MDTAEAEKTKARQAQRLLYVLMAVMIGGLVVGFVVDLILRNR